MSVAFVVISWLAILSTQGGVIISFFPTIDTFDSTVVISSIAKSLPVGVLLSTFAREWANFSKHNYKILRRTNELAFASAITDNTTAVGVVDDADVASVGNIALVSYVSPLSSEFSLEHVTVGRCPAHGFYTMHAKYTRTLTSESESQLYDDDAYTTVSLDITFEPPV